MSTNMIELINKYITPDVVSRLAGFLGESPQDTGSSVKLAIPSILAGIAHKYANPQDAGSLLSLLKNDNHDGSVLDTLSASLGGGDSTTSLVNTGTKMLSSILGNNGSNLANLVSNNSGVSNKSASSILGLAVPIVLGAIGKVVKSEYISNPAQLISLLKDQSSYLKGLLPASITSLLGIGNLGSHAATKTVTEETGGIRKLLPWLFVPFLALLAAGALKSCSGPKVPTLSFFEETLPTGFALKGALEGIEGKLVVFIKNPMSSVDKEMWFTMDNITFDTDKATIKSESNVQLTNIAEIMRAYPSVKIKIGGYTDNTGDANANQILSANRAISIQNALIGMGINNTRIETEGYGSEHPVASNQTAEGRQQNRRIDVRVLAK